MGGLNLNSNLSQNLGNSANNSSDFHHTRFQHIRSPQGNIAVPPHLEVKLQAFFLVFMTQAQGQISNAQELAAIQTRFQQALQEACAQHLQHPETSLQDCISEKINSASLAKLTQVWSQVQGRWNHNLLVLLSAQNPNQVYSAIASVVRQQLNEDRSFSRPTQQKELSGQLCEQLLALVQARGGQSALDSIMEGDNGLRNQIGINEIVDSARRMTLVGANLQENIGVVLNQASSFISNRAGALLARRGFQVQSLAISGILGGLTGAIQGGGQIALSYYSMNAEQRQEQRTRLLWEFAKSVGVGVVSGLCGYLGELAQQKLGLEHNWVSNAVVFAATDVGSEVGAQIGLDRLGVRLHLEEERFFTGNLASNFLSNGLEELVSAKVHGPLLRSPARIYHWAGTYFPVSDVIPQLDRGIHFEKQEALPEPDLSLQRRAQGRGPLGLDVDALASQVPHYLATPSFNSPNSAGQLNRLWADLPSNVQRHFFAHDTNWQMAGRSTATTTVTESARLENLTLNIHRTLEMIQESIKGISANTFPLEKRLTEIQTRLEKSEVLRDREYLEDLKDASNILLNRLRALMRTQIAETAKEERHEDDKKINLHKFFTEKVNAKVRETEIDSSQQVLENNEESLEIEETAKDETNPPDPKPPRPSRVQEDVFGAPWKKGQKVPALVNIHNPEIDFSLRAHQWQMLANIDTDWTRPLAQNERRQGVVISPTGSGKTRAMAGTIALGLAQGRIDFEKGDKVVICTHLESIRDQNLGKIYALLNPIFRKKYGRDVVVSEVCGNSDDYNGDVVIVSVPKVGKEKSGFKEKLKRKLKPGARVGLTLLDEYHHGEADTWQRTRNHLAELGNGNHYELGFTATLPSDERANTNIVYELNFLEAMKKGIIPPLTLVELRTLISLAKVSIRGSGSKISFNESELSQTVRNSARDIKIWSGFEAHGLRQKNGRPQASLCTAVDIAHMEELARSYQIYSRTPVENRPPCINDKGEAVPNMGLRNIAILENPQKEDIAKLDAYVAALQDRKAVNYQCYEFHSDSLKDPKNDRRYVPQSGTATTSIQGIAVTITGNTHPDALKKIEEYASQGLIDIVFYVKKWGEGKDAWWARNTLAGRPWLSEIGSGQELGRLCRYGPDEVSDEGVIQQVVERRALSFIDSSDAKRVLQTYARVMGLDLTKMHGKLGMPLDIVRDIFGAQGHGKLEIERDASGTPNLKDPNLVEFPEATEVLRGARSHLLIPDEQLEINKDKLPNVPQALKFREVFRGSPYHRDLINFAFDLAITEEEAVGIMNAYLPMSDRLAERISTLAYQDRQRLILDSKQKVKLQGKDYSQVGAIENMTLDEFWDILGLFPEGQNFDIFKIKPDRRRGFVVGSGTIEIVRKIDEHGNKIIQIRENVYAKEVNKENQALIDRFYSNPQFTDFNNTQLGRQQIEALVSLSELGLKRLFKSQKNASKPLEYKIVCSNRRGVQFDVKEHVATKDSDLGLIRLSLKSDEPFKISVSLVSNYSINYELEILLLELSKNPLFEISYSFRHIGNPFDRSQPRASLHFPELELNGNFNHLNTDTLEFEIQGGGAVQFTITAHPWRTEPLNLEKYVKITRAMQNGHWVYFIEDDSPKAPASFFIARLLLHPYAINVHSGQTQPSELDLKIKPLVLDWAQSAEIGNLTKIEKQLEDFNASEKEYLFKLTFLYIQALMISSQKDIAYHFYNYLLPRFVIHFSNEQKIEIFKALMERLDFDYPPSSVEPNTVSRYFDSFSTFLVSDLYQVLPSLIEKLNGLETLKSWDVPFINRYQNRISKILLYYSTVTDSLNAGNARSIKEILEAYAVLLNRIETMSRFLAILKSKIDLILSGESV